MLYVTSTEEAVIKIRQEFCGCELSSETVGIENATGRILAEDIYSDEDIPHFNRSTLDGYAVKAKDTFGAGEAIPSILKLTGNVEMGKVADFSLKSGETAYVSTGGAMPEGSDCVAKIEIAEKIGDEVLIYKSVAPATGVIFAGDDIKKGEVALKENQKISAKHIGTLAALGKSRVKVKRQPICGIISTGDEITSIDEKFDGKKARVRDVNSFFLKAQAIKFGCDVINYGICRDNKKELVSIIKKAYNECDIVLVSGGSSVGIMDRTADAIAEAAKARIFIHGISMKPGKPTVIARAGSKALAGLPGHPVSAYFVMEEIIQEIINTLYGVEKGIVPVINAKINANISSNHGRDDFIPVRLEKNETGLTAIPIGYKSGLITLLSGADGYIKISGPLEGLDSGSMVEVRLL